MHFYKIKDNYIEFLHEYDSKVAENKREGRPYVGIVLKINDIEYYAPFTSPKSKHLHMSNSKDFRKIGNGRFGAINFNNMIPVPLKELIELDITNEPDLRYKRLLQNQYQSIKSDWTAIKKTAEELRNLIFTPDEDLSDYDKRVKSRCCNLPLLESVFNTYSQ